MNKKWNEKTTFEKVLDIISGIALCVWVIFAVLERTNGDKWTEIGEYISIGIIGVCQGISFWNVKRVISYIAIGGVVCIVATVVLETLLVA